MPDELLAEAKIHLAERPPVACASCFGQYVDRRHVDFGAGYDGVSMPPDSQAHIAGAKWSSVDDLIICEECLTAGAKVLGLVDAEPLEQRIADQEELLDELRGRILKAVEYAKTVDQALQDRGSLEDALKPRQVQKPQARR